MKLYQVRSCYDSIEDDFICKGMSAQQGFDLYKFYDEAPRDGGIIPMAWHSDDENKLIADASVSAEPFLIVSQTLRSEIRNYLPRAKAFDGFIDGSNDKFVMFSIPYYESLEGEMEHFFWFTDYFPRWCCTEKFKCFWESRNLNGLEFKLAGIFDDQLFLAVGGSINNRIS